jgi:N-acetylneuraminic acid mutarotase
MSWTQEPPLNHPRFRPVAAVCNAPAPGSGTRIYAVGGNDSTAAGISTVVEVYDTTQKTWSTTASMLSPRSGFAAASVGGKLHVLGGFDSSSTALATHDVYDPTTNKWSSLAPLPTARANLAAVTGTDGLIYAIGGSGSPNYLSTVEAYDPAHDTWSSKQQMLTPRMGLATVVTPNGSIYAIGGINSVIVNSVEIFDVSANSWIAGSHPLPLPTAWLDAAVGPNGLIYAIGGMQQQPGASNPPFVANVYSYNPADILGWAQQAPLPDVRACPAAATGPDGLIYAIGGMTCPQGAIVGEVQAYTFDKCDYIQYELSVAASEMAAAQATLDGGDLTPQQRAAGEKSLIGLRTQLENLEKALQICHG